MPVTPTAPQDKILGWSADERFILERARNGVSAVAPRFLFSRKVQQGKVDADGKQFGGEALNDVMEADAQQKELRRITRETARQVTARLKKRPLPKEQRDLVAFCRARWMRTDLSPREIGRRMGFSEAKSDDLSRQLKDLGIMGLHGNSR